MSNNKEIETMMNSFIEDLKQGTLLTESLTEADESTAHRNRALAVSDVLAIVYGGKLANSELAEWDWPWSKTRKEKCPNGEERTILKDPNEAFELYQTDWTAKMNAVFDALKQVSVKVGVDLQRRVVSLFNGLGAMNGKAQQDYNAAYKVYAGAPCNNDVLAWWMRVTEKIMDKSDKLSLFQTQLTAAMLYPQTLEKALDNVHKQVELLKDELMPKRP